jgi:hypothetical protein
MPAASGLRPEELTMLLTERTDFHQALKDTILASRQSRAVGFAVMRNAVGLAVTNVFQVQPGPCNPNELFRMATTCHRGTVEGLFHAHDPWNPAYGRRPEFPTSSDVLATAELRQNAQSSWIIEGIVSYVPLPINNNLGRLVLARPLPSAGDESTVPRTIDRATIETCYQTDDPHDDEPLLRDCGLAVAKLTLHAPTGHFRGTDADIAALYGVSV